ncbi:hypothetical protein B0T16DRAFT_390245 [Cercophora newfieldiana]|uniref:N-acetyltransferase domain-containing protein n=1 Tax=Cercophora newfieldiana TaxID=92897 RepID=A0AA40CP79_9PEZI|nr:hypothetical protein B0T16DRAFT_390245 [Cercophora newfieldiana]
MDTTPSGTYIFTQEQHQQLIPWIAALHASCITQDHMVGPFLPPLTNEKLLPWWRERIAEVNAGTRVIVLLLAQTTPAKKAEGRDFRGLAMFKTSDVETGTFRGHIDAVLVNQKYRRQGGARALVRALEYEAARKGRTLLLVDTETGSVAEAAFKSFGYVEVGKIPAYSHVLPNGKRGGTFFYKDLVASS